MNDTYTQKRILIIDDNREIHNDYKKILNPKASNNSVLDALDAFLDAEDSIVEPTPVYEDLIVDSAYQGQEGLEMVIEAMDAGRPYSMAFVDMRMPPGWDGLRTIEEIWKVAPDLQVVICTAYSDNSWEDIVDRVGRSDKFLILKKPFDRVEVSQLAVALTEKWQLTQQARLKNCALERLVEERTKQLSHAALHDPLTDLPNRKLYNMKLCEAIKRKDKEDIDSVIMLLDLDHFKKVNDTEGHLIGDSLLVELADRLKRNTRPKDIVARLGGDEFAIIWNECTDPYHCESSIKRLHDALAEPYVIDDRVLDCKPSIGISILDQKGCIAEELIRKADLALYRAKEQGRGQYCIFDQKMDDEQAAIRKTEADLQVAVKHNQFQLYYQPIVDIKSNRIVTMEALIRWIHPEKGLIPPNDFIPIAEETGIIGEIGKWVIQKAISDALTWPSDVRVAINASAVQFHTKHRLVETILEALAYNGLCADRLELEITESLLLSESEEVLNALHALREVGVRIVLDDFGTGYSSLKMLRCFPFDKLKLDKLFVTDAGNCDDAQAIIRAVGGLGVSLGMESTAEGIEDLTSLEIVTNERFTQAQGFHFGKPTPVTKLPELFRKYNRSTYGAPVTSADDNTMAFAHVNSIVENGS